MCPFKYKESHLEWRRRNPMGSYHEMIRRCYDKNRFEYPRYGGKGITVCNEWRNSRKLFYEWSHRNGWKPGLTIHRIDPNGGYSPNNCQWITRNMNALLYNCPDMWKEHPATKKEIRLLTFLENNPKLKISQIQPITQIYSTKEGLYQALMALIKRGLVSRTQKRPYKYYLS